MANKILKVDETTITWRNTSGTELFTPTSLASGAGRQGALHDFGVGSTARSRRYMWRAFLIPGATRVVGEVINVYWKTSDGTHPDNDDGTGDIAVSADDKLRNLKQIGQIVIDENAAVEMVDHGEFEFSERHAAPVFWNATANSLSTTAGDFGFDLTPVPSEAQ